ncbi:MAG: CehA/McbA family metallohydrolase [Bryobacterales bacterium]|nr:CehA/McbA family metallohydrolase [Bryobacterales bacterium]
MRRRELVCGLAAGRLLKAAGGPVECRIVDRETGGPEGAPVPARIRLVDAAGNEAAPLGHPATLAEEAQEGDVRFQSRRFSYVNGSFRVDPASLPLKYQVVKGYEYAIAEGEITGAGPIPISRWSSIGGRGWFGGDIHIHHISPKTCRLEMEAEDLNVANILTSDFTADQDRFQGQTDIHSTRGRLVYVTQEFRNHQLGHLCLLNLKKLIQPVKTAQAEHYPLHLGVCDQAHAQGGYVSWAHFPSWPGVECPLDVISEKLDGLEILSVLDPREFAVFTRQVVPEVQANDGLRLWYRYLNCGFKLTATAGTDKMTNYVTVGANRVYAKVDGELSYQAWIDALRRGRTFVTNSPLLSFTVNGREAGETLELKRGKASVVSIQASAESQLPYHKLEIVVNGQTVADSTPDGRNHRAQIHLERPLEGSCWIAARVVEDLRPYRQRGVAFSKVHAVTGTLLGDYFGTRRPETVFAHSSPCYVILDGKPIRSWDDAGYYVRYMDQSIQWLEREGKFARPTDKRATIEAFRQGRARWLARQK